MAELVIHLTAPNRGSDVTELVIHMTTEQARHILADMKRRGASDPESHGDTDRFFNLLSHHVRGSESKPTVPVPPPTWNGGRWNRRNSTGEWFYSTAFGTLMLARVTPVGRSVWYIDLYPTGRRIGAPIPEDTEHLHPIHTLAAAKRAAAEAWNKVES